MWWAGFCLEKTAAPSTSRFKAAEHEERILSCYEKAGDMAILFFQEHERNTSQNLSTSSLSMGEVGVGPPVDQAIQHSPVTYVKNG